MSTKQVTVLARFKAKKGSEADLAQVLGELASEARNDQGCLAFELLRSQKDPTLFMYHEVWASQSDLDNHIKMPYLPAYRERRAPLLDCEPEVATWEILAS
jgi:quinol monooxygenase YgiN